GRLDLAQAEAVADLIEAGSAAAAKAALASLEGRFSREIQALAAELLRLRVEIEARLDFPDDEIDRAGTLAALHALQERLRKVGEAAASGRRLAEGFVCVLAGAPNVGKSSLLNALAGSERAIVTELPGTTRDPIEVDITLDGLALRLVDTAGLRDSDDRIEAEGVRRARERAAGADLVLEVRDDRVPMPALSRASGPRLLVINKIDLSGRSPGSFRLAGERAVAVSASTGAGLEDLAACLREHALGGSFDEAAGFSARRRHLDALSRVSNAVSAAAAALASGDEVAAEELRRAQSALGEITGEVTTEDLLGAIFSSFCLGK
ncbi:MAG TPA: GTPase, partial [Gammaproteobacteria bacterium]|nr:GTPase [Gammaproteobacteria bacterium]